MPTRNVPTRLLALPLLAALALATDAEAGPRTVPPGGSPGAGTDPGAIPVSPGVKLSELIGVPIAAMMTEQSIYIPCYAFTPISGATDWRPKRSACFTMKKNQVVELAAPLHFPVTHGVARVKKLRCYAYSDHAGDEIRYRAWVMRGNTEVAKLEATQNKLDAAEDAGTVHQANAEIDAAKYHYDLSIAWQVEVPEGEGWLPQANEFRGCRVDYVVANF